MHTFDDFWTNTLRFRIKWGMESMFMKLYEETNLRTISLPLGNVDAGFRSVECVSMFNKCRSFFCVRLSTNTSCECTRVTRFKSVVLDSYPEKGRVSTEKSKSRQKKKSCQGTRSSKITTSWKASNRLRPGDTMCMMPKYVDTIQGRLQLCSGSSVIGLCNRKGNDTTSCRTLWKKDVLPDEQETFVCKLYTLTAAYCWGV